MPVIRIVLDLHLPLYPLGSHACFMHGLRRTYNTDKARSLFMSLSKPSLLHCVLVSLALFWFYVRVVPVILSVSLLISVLFCVRLAVYLWPPRSHTGNCLGLHACYINFYSLWFIYPKIYPFSAMVRRTQK